VNEFVEHAATYGWRASPENNGTVLERAPAAGIR
jgi:hypothetical protein